MKVKFEWPGLVVEMDNFAGQIFFTMTRPGVTVGSADGQETVIEPEHKLSIGLDKSSARSIASALMGAAAEL